MNKLERNQKILGLIKDLAIAIAILGIWFHLYDAYSDSLLLAGFCAMIAILITVVRCVILIDTEKEKDTTSEECSAD